MSGPKSTRYTLTPEQRRILAEARERERKTKKEWERLKQLKAELVALNDGIRDSAQNVDLLVERTGTGRDIQIQIKEILTQLQKSMEEAGKINEKSGLENLQQTNHNILGTVKKSRKVQELCDGKNVEIKEKLDANISDSILSGMNLRIEDQITESLSHVEQQRKKIKEVLNTVDEWNVSIELKKEQLEIKKKAEEITNDNFIDNFYAMTVTPFLKKCRKYHELMEENGEEFEELCSKYRYYSDYLGLIATQDSFSIEQMEALRERIQTLEQQCEQLEEQRYISEAVDEVMRDMGYHVIGSREVTKKSGRRFRNELYHFSEGTAVNITYASSGQISMELGGVDYCDREPSEKECSTLCEEMTDFCDSFKEVERRLKEKGVILASRISMLPPSEEYAQIINVKDYDMKETVECFATETKHKNERTRQVMRKE